MSRNAAPAARVAVSRALLDYYCRPRKRGEVRPDADDEGSPKMPGVVGATGHRIILDVANPVVARKLIEICDEALQSDAVHEAKINAIRDARRLIVAAVEDANHG